MKKLLLTLLLLPSVTLGGELKAEVIPYGDLEIHYFDDNKVQVFTDGAHKFGIDCSDRMMCNAYVTHSLDAEYSVQDGVVLPDNSILRLSSDSIRHVIQAHSDELIFILNTTGYSGRAWQVQRFLIHADGSFSSYTEAYNFMQYGISEDDYPLDL